MSLEQTLVDALTSIIASIELTDDDDLDPDVATDITEPVAAMLQDMTADDRRRLAELSAHSAEAETNPERRELIEQFPEAYGLIEEE
jgi:hypothetical protein